MALEVDFKDVAVMRDPYGAFEALRCDDPVQWNASLGGWVLVNYDDIQEMLKNTGDFSSARMCPYTPREKEHSFTVEQLTGILSKFLVFMDPPDQTRIRDVVNGRFIGPVVERKREHVQRIVDELIDGFIEKGEADLIRDLANPTPSIVICDMMDVPREMIPPIRVWVDAVAEYIASSADAARYDRARDGLFALYGYFSRLVLEREKNPGDDLVSILIQAVHSGSLTQEEMIVTCILFIVGGQETTASLIGNGFYHLFRNPDQLARLRSDPTLIRSAVEEILRFTGTAISIVRIVARDTEFKGKPFKQGDVVFGFIAAANRDPEVFPDPQQMDVGRNRNRHLGFGHGNHVCLGAALARVETQSAIGGALARLQNLEIVDWPLYKPQFHLRGVASLAVRFTPGKKICG